MRSSFLRRVFSFPVMLAGMLPVLAVLTVRSRFDDPDLWWNLKIGEVIWTTHTIPVTDLFSYTTNHHRWIPHEWLAQIVIYAAYKWAGYRGLMLLLCLLSSTLLIAGYGLCSLYARNWKMGFLGAFTIWLFSTIGLSIRAQMIGYIFLIVELLLLQLGRTRNPRWFLWLPVLFLVWVNCHASFFLGMIVAAVVLGCSYLNMSAGPLVSARWEGKSRRTLVAALLLSGAALFLNPVGMEQILYPVETMVKMPLLLASVAEYAPLTMSSELGVALMAVLLLIFLLVAAGRAEMRWEELILVGMGTWLAVSHVRMLFVFGILVAPVLSRLLASWWGGERVEADRPWLNAGFIAISIFAACLAFPSSRNLEAQVEQKSPVKAVEFIRANHLSGPMLNTHGFGGYLMWAAPEYPVFIDGRTDVFEWTGVLREFGDWATLQSDPDVLLNKYGVGFCLLNRESPMVRVLPLLPDWKTVYSDGNAVVIARVFPRRADGETAQNHQTGMSLKKGFLGEAVGKVDARP